MVLFFRDFKGSSDLIWCGWATIVNLWTPVTLKNRQPCWKWICWVTAVMVDQWIVLSFNLSASFSYIFLFIYVLLVVLAQCKLFCALLLFCFVLLSVCAAVYPEHSWHCGLLCPGCSAHNQKATWPGLCVTSVTFWIRVTGWCVELQQKIHFLSEKCTL